MSAPWIEAWKAWLARGAELFVKREGPVSTTPPQRVAPPHDPHAPAQTPAHRKGPPHRSGQRHG